MGESIGRSRSSAVRLADRDTTISNLEGVFLFTSKAQMIVQISSPVMTAHNDWEMQGDWPFLLFNQDTYGLGTGPTPVGSGFTLSGCGVRIDRYFGVSVGSTASWTSPPTRPGWAAAAPRR